MKKTLLNVALAASMGVSGVAAAADLKPADAAYTIFLSGATASAQFVRNAIIRNVCRAPQTAPNEITVYQKDGDDWTVICEVNSTTDATNPVVEFVKQGGGSGDGTTPISQPAASALLYPKLSANFDPAATGVGGSNAGEDVCVAAAVPSVLPGTAIAFGFHDCQDVVGVRAGIANVVINGGDIGTSDVEPPLFFDVNTPSTGIAFSAADAGAITSAPLAGLAFGVGVTTSLREALQALQFPASSPCHPAHPSHNTLLPVTLPTGEPAPNDQMLYDVGRVAATGATGELIAVDAVSPSLGTATVADSLYCMPSLSHETITGIFTGGLTLWEQIVRHDAGAAAPVNLVEAATAAGVPVPAAGAGFTNDRRVHICRRNAGSGTNAQFEAIFLNRPCANINGQFQSRGMISAAAGDSCDLLGGSVVCNNRGSSDLGRCLDDLQTAGNSQGLFPGNTILDQPRFAWGIGYQSTEKNQSLGRGWRFVRVNGMAPTLNNIHMASYMDHAEQTCQRRVDESPLDPNVPAGVLTQVFAEVCNAGPTDVFFENLTFLHPWGQGGWLSVPDEDGPNPGTNAAVAESPLMSSQLMDTVTPLPINSWSRSGPNGPSTCQPGRVVDDVLHHNIVDPSLGSHGNLNFWL